MRLQAHVNAFNNILADLTQLGVKVDDEDKTIILLCYLPSSYGHLVTTLTNGKELIMMNSIYSILLQHTQRRQSVEESGRSSGESLFVKGGQDNVRDKGKVVGYRKKRRFKSKDKKIIECYGCKQIDH